MVTTTLKDLEAAAGRARTGGGTRVPMSQLIRWAATSHHYLAVFDQAKPLALFHTKRFASLAQRLMLLAKNGGCTKPGCDARPITARRITFRAGGTPTAPTSTI
ncbi:hypothetical protein BZL30_1055 [Mycobacterium kansasii]|uniref:DUF222 domain-containing protein n=1 Tax=Mycobacterium kansasii TaxID=1768 RepID=A0A1V3XU06_MYCKA|nr:hypothetical protein BZL30_1055 [Mycobacterium kansasii]